MKENQGTKKWTIFTGWFFKGNRKIMNVALYGKTLDPKDAGYIQDLVDQLELRGGKIFIIEPFCQFIMNLVRFTQPPVCFSRQSDIKDQVEFLFSIGGDGTLLDTITLVGDSGIPIVGINMGRLGFLSIISKQEILPAFREIIAKKYSVESRTLLRLETVSELFGNYNYALNDLTVYKKTPYSMLTIRTYIDDKFLNTYWADGLIVATPTGSTAYSLSCTGPIITPDSANFVITPIASHNLTVRPIVVPDKSIIRILVDGRGPEYFVGLDSRIESFKNPLELVVKKENFTINLLQLSNKNFFSTIREKLNWGLDIRN
jgi:NAD+ kinase